MHSVHILKSLAFSKLFFRADKREKPSRLVLFRIAHSSPRQPVFSSLSSIVIVFQDSVIINNGSANTFDDEDSLRSQSWLFAFEAERLIDNFGIENLVAPILRVTLCRKSCVLFTPHSPAASISILSRLDDLHAK